MIHYIWKFTSKEANLHSISPKNGFVSSSIEHQEAYTGYDSREPEEKQWDYCKPVD